MKNIFYTVLLVFVFLALQGCAPQTNISVTTAPGQCPGGQESAPYCLAVTMQNNESGQNWISSTNYPFTNVTVSVSGVSNVLSPSTTAAMDPNGCTKNNTSPGGSCTFYLQINQEQYPVGSVTPVIVAINYTVNNGLSAVLGLGGGGTAYNYQFTVNEYTNLYAVQQNSNVTIYNNNNLKNFSIESMAAARVQSVAVDNSTFGYVWIGTNQGMYWFGTESYSGNTSYNPPGGGGVSNIFTSQDSPFESAATAPTAMYGVGSSIYQFTFSSQSWGTTALATAPTGVLNNVNAVSSSGGYMILTNRSIIYACPTSGTTGVCNQEATPLTGVTSLGFVTIESQPGNTGLYVGTINGLFTESGTQFPQPSGTVNSWESVTGGGIESQSITVLTTDDSGDIFVGGNNGNIWKSNGGSNTAILLTTVGSDPIYGIIFDNIGNTLYVVSGSTLYQCPLLGSCTAIGPLVGSSSMVGLAIGSSLSN